MNEKEKRHGAMIWVEIPGFNGRYSASSAGKIRSNFSVYNGKQGLFLFKTMPLWEQRGGYLCASLRQEGKTRSQLVHRLVLLAFFGEPQKGFEGAHLDGNRKNNSVDNLAWVTRSENHSHKWQHGTRQVGERGPSAKLTNNQAREIKRLFASGVSRPDLARLFVVSHSTIWLLTVGKTWVGI